MCRQKPMHLLITSRLILRPYATSDYDVISHLLCHPATMKWVMEGPCVSEQEVMIKYLGRHFQISPTGTGIGVLVRRAAPQTPIGFAGLLLSTHRYAIIPELGFALAPGQQGRGYATEIGRAQISHALGPLFYPRVVAHTSPRNTPSIHVIKKLGMTFVREVNHPERGIRRLYCKCKALLCEESCEIRRQSELYPS